ncbi:MAG: hypothetical protein ABIJ96_05885, partial [Elusimicrobiota bacterium]
LLLSVAFRFRMDRFAAFLFPLFFILFSAGLCGLFAAVRKGSRRVYGSALAVGLYLLIAPWPAKALAVPFSSRGLYEGFATVEVEKAVADIRPRFKPGDVFAARASFLVSHYLGRRIDYVISDFFGAVEKAKIAPHYSGAARIVDAADMEKVMLANSGGWIIFNKQRWDQGYVLSPPLREVILRHARRVSTRADESVVVFRWGHRDGRP